MPGGGCSLPSCTVECWPPFLRQQMGGLGGRKPGMSGSSWWGREQVWTRKEFATPVAKALGIVQRLVGVEEEDEAWLDTVGSA